MLPHTARSTRIPVYLLTGYLGSGKTTLLAAWLQAKELAQSALIINEVGEVGLDQHALRGMVESAALVANACICCTGLPGLEEALADLFWSRLHRKTEPFAAVIIETTGLADPLPIVQVFKRDALLRERYRLAGVVTTLSATSGLQALAQQSEAASQVRTANLVIITKIDVAPATDVAALQLAVRALNPIAGLATSAQASLRAGTMLDLLALHPLMDVEPPEDDKATRHHMHEHHEHAHEALHHDAQALFLPLPEPLQRQAFWAQLERWIHRHQPSLLRIKGLVQISDGSLVTVQWSLGDTQADMAPHGNGADQPHNLQLGLTIIVKKDFDNAAGSALLRALVVSHGLTGL